MAELKIVATIEIKKNFNEDAINILKEVVNETRKEEGCMSYDLHQDVQNPQKYTILEVWQSQDAINSHNNSEHFKKFVKDIEGKTESLTVNIIKKIY